MVNVLMIGTIACGSRAQADKAAGAPPEAVAPVAPHGNHVPRFGGVVLMNGLDLHFEVVLDRGGHHRVYFSDGMRNPLPASAASDVTIAVQRPGKSAEQVALAIDDRDESWVGQGQPIGGPSVVARISYAYRGQPYWIDLPFDMSR
jgi:hypothetical protein